MSNPTPIGTCPKCYKGLPDNLAECPFCGILIDKFIERQGKVISGEISLISHPISTGTPFSLFDWIAANKAATLVMVLAGFFILGRIKNALIPIDLSELRLTPAEANTLTSDPCLNKQRCLMVLVAPWCPVCHAARPQIVSLRDSWRDSKRLGLKIIVGADKMNALQEEARQLGDNTYVDPDNRFVHATGFNVYPTWVVLDPNGKVLAHVTGLFEGDADIARYTLLDKLHLVKF